MPSPEEAICASKVCVAIVRERRFPPAAMGPGEEKSDEASRIEDRQHPDHRPAGGLVRHGAPDAVYGAGGRPAFMAMSTILSASRSPQGEVKLTTDRTSDAKSRKYQYTFPIDQNGDYKGTGIAPGNYVAVVFSGRQEHRLQRQRSACGRRRQGGELRHEPARSTSTR